MKGQNHIKSGGQNQKGLDPVANSKQEANSNCKLGCYLPQISHKSTIPSTIQRFIKSVNFQSRDLEDRETQEATMSVCMYVCLYVCMSQTSIRFKSMNSSVNSFPE